MSRHYGEIISALPEGFVPYQQWPEFDLGHMPLQWFKPELAGRDPLGVRWGLWPFTFEEYVSLREPDMALSDPGRTARTRMVVWRRPLSAQRPPGWYQPSFRPSRLEGFADLAGQKNYFERWDESARRYRKRWIERHIDKTHRVEKISYETFADTYLKSDLPKELKKNTLTSLKQKLDADARGNIQIHAVRDIKTDELVAGMAVLNSLVCKGSYYICGFIHAEAHPAPAMIGLMDRWFSACQAGGIRFLHFGEFWIPGKPKGWKGFSLFKSKFGLYYIAYPPALIRLAWGKLF